MNVQVNGNRNIRVYFKHDEATPLTLEQRKELKAIRKAIREGRKRNSKHIPHRKTLCSIVEFINGFSDNTNVVEHAQGEAQVHPLDIFSKEAGRKISLTRAMKNLSMECFNKDERTQIWNAYHKSQNNLTYIK